MTSRGTRSSSEGSGSIPALPPDIVLRHGSRHGDGHRVSGNVIIGARTGSFIPCGTSDTEHPASYLPVFNTVISRNTIINPGTAGIHLGSWKHRRWHSERWATHSNAAAEMVANIAPHGNAISENTVVADEGIPIIAENCPENKLVDNLLWTAEQAHASVSGETAIIMPVDSRALATGDLRLTDASLQQLQAWHGKTVGASTIRPKWGPDEQSDDACGSAIGRAIYPPFGGFRRTSWRADRRHACQLFEA